MGSGEADTSATCPWYQGQGDDISILQGSLEEDKSGYMCTFNALEDCYCDGVITINGGVVTSSTPKTP